jgi:hypothetical protein
MLRAIDVTALEREIKTSVSLAILTVTIRELADKVRFISSLGLGFAQV